MKNASAPAPVVDLPEHLDNPFIAGLGPPPSLGQQFSIVQRSPVFSEDERSLPPHLRRYCVLRLFDFVHARSCQVRLVERIGMLIRGGYKGRNPTSGEHRACILDAADRREQNDVRIVSKRVSTVATGFALLGQPGMGKSLTVDIALESYPKVLRPALPYVMVQVPWLKIECPTKGGQKQFCIAFFKALGDRVGDDYYQRYGRGGKGGDNMLLDVQQLCQVHAVGVIVLDELQHLLDTKEGPKPLMNFLVTLVNTVGVPVILVGTMGATSIVERDFRSARRAAGLGQPTWTRLRPGPEWDDLVAEIWKYQWTAEVSELTEEVKAALYYECQGIIDLLVKLFILCQFRAISVGETRPDTREVITPALVASVAEDEFRVIRPMMRALREGREDLLESYPDLKEFHHHVSARISQDAKMTMKELRTRWHEGRRSVEVEAAAPGDPLNPIRAMLAARGLAPDIVEATLAEAVRRDPSQDPFRIVGVVQEILEGNMPARTVGRRRASRPRPAAPGGQLPEAGAKASPTEGFEADDLRGQAAEAKRRDVPVHARFVETGVSQTVAEIVAA